MSLAEVGHLLSVAALAGGVAYMLGKRHGHRQGWYHGYSARMYETFDGENYQ